MEQNAASHSQSDQLNVDWFNYRRRVSRQIKVGDLALGGDAPIRIQSMTTADTLDVEKTVDESIRMVDAGSELVRITAPSQKEAEALGSIAKASTPLPKTNDQRSTIDGSAIRHQIHHQHPLELRGTQPLRIRRRRKNEKETTHTDPCPRSGG